MISQQLLEDSLKVSYWENLLTEIESKHQYNVTMTTNFS